MKYSTQNPTDLTVLREYNYHSNSEILSFINESYSSWVAWRNSSFSKRSESMLQLAEGLRAQKKELARLAALEMGKPLNQGEMEVNKCADACEFFAASAEKFLAEEEYQAHYKKSFVTYRPLGPVLLIMPWNFPFWQVIRAAVPAMMAGNTIFLKHAESVSGCAEKLAEVFKTAFHNNEFVNVRATHEQCHLFYSSPSVAGVSFTGSTEGGKKIASLASGNLKKIVLELGGSDPYIVLKDAEIEKAAEICVNARLVNTGQSCVAAKRFIIEKPVFEEFKNLFIEKMKLKKMGNPLEDGIDLGPLAAIRFVDQLETQVKKSIEKGARLEMGGKRGARGAFYEPTVLTAVTTEQPAFKEELFGPVAALIEAESETQAIQLANKSRFGLGAAIFTRDIERGRKIATNEIDAGYVIVNDSVKSDARLPFGGVKESGLGREIGPHGLREFCNVKTIGLG
ncbi:MAG: NAD-dependent succinate-semialdehyde dehydrogenase [Pseudobdellovibrionaceae bacterium]